MSDLKIIPLILIEKGINFYNMLELFKNCVVKV